MEPVVKVQAELKAKYLELLYVLVHPPSGK